MYDRDDQTDVSISKENCSKFPFFFHPQQYLQHKQAKLITDQK